MRYYHVVGKIGYFWRGPTVYIGHYRWFCVAWIMAKLWLVEWRYSRAFIIEQNTGPYKRSEPRSRRIVYGNPAAVDRTTH